jgi:hypothetical protein
MVSYISGITKRKGVGNASSGNLLFILRIVHRSEGDDALSTGRVAQTPATASISIISLEAGRSLALPCSK